MATFEGLPDPSQVSSAGAAARAAQAEAANQAYRQNTAPVLPAYAPGGGASITQAQRDDAAREEAKRVAAFSQPRDDTRLSPAAQDIVNQYAASRNRVVGGGGVMYQGSTPTVNPYREDSALGIAWEVSRTGGATDIQLNKIAEASALPGGVYAGADTSFIRYASDIYRVRPSFERQVLTTKEGQQFTNEAWAGVPIRLNLTKAEMAGGAGITQENIDKYYKYNPATHNLDVITPSNAVIDIDPGVHKAFGDFGGPILKGSTYGGIQIGNNGLSVAGIATSGRTARTKMMAAEPVYGTVTKTPGELPAPFKSIPGEGAIIAPKGELQIPFTDIKFTIPVISEGIAFFQPAQRMTVTKTGETVLPEETRLVKTAYTPFDETRYYETTGGKQTTYAGTGVPIAGSSGFDKFEQSIRDTLHLPSIEVGERAVRTAQYANPFVGPFILAGDIAKTGSEAIFGKESTFAKTAKENAETGYALAPFSQKGQYEMFYEHPTLTALSYAAGGIFGTGAKAAESAYMASRGVIAEKAISQGGIYRAVEQGTGTVMKWGPRVLEGVYALDIAARSTKGFSDFRPQEAIPRARAIAVQEAYPMMAGFEAPGQFVKAVRTAEIGYKQSLLLGDVSGRFGYYVKEPMIQATRPYTAGYKAQAMAVKEATGKELGVGEYIIGKAQRGVYDIADTLSGIPARASSVHEAIYRPYFDAKVHGILPLGGPKYAEVTRGYTPFEGIEAKAYGKQKTFFDVAAAGIKTARVKAMDITDIPGRMAAASRRTSITPEIQRPIIPEFTTIGVYQKTTSGQKVESFVDWLYKPRLEKIISPSTFGETAPFGRVVTVTPGREGRGTTTKGGGPSAPEPMKFRKTPYGTGLAKEPSLKSMGIKEPSMKGKSPLRGEQVQDFRGRPASERMKPMTRESLGYQGGKQAAGRMNLLTEELPKVEGLTETRVRIPVYERFVGAPSLQGVSRSQGVVQVVEPELTFSQVSARRQQQEVVPASMSRVAQLAAQQQLPGQRSMEATIQGLRTGTFTAQAEKTAQTQRMDTRLGMSTREGLDIRDALDQFTRVSPRVDTGVRTTPYTTTRQRTDQITTPDRITIPDRVTVPRPWKEIIPEIVPPITPIGGIGAGSGSGGGGGRGAFRFVERLSLVMPPIGGATARAIRVRTAPTKYKKAATKARRKK